MPDANGHNPGGLALAATGVAAPGRSYEAGTRLGLHAHAEARLLFAASGAMQVTRPRDAGWCRPGGRCGCPQGWSTRWTC
ncbi:MAG: hypothetical protein EXR07_09400 [Acetobacteraceae bacterium]|nr:hypothetical protein [Acetobacteraceae bacterium]